MGKFIDAFIISWPGKHEHALEIAEALQGSVDRLTVLYANKDDVVERRPSNWAQFPNSWYFGAQFAEMLRRFRGDILLHVMADASSEDWPGLVAALREAHRKLPQTGIWSPLVDHSAQPLDELTLGRIANTSVHLVIQTDCTVWALSNDIVEHMRGLDYGLTPLGWGIDVAAAMHCFSVGKPVLLDTQVSVLHPRTTGYDGSEAEIQKRRFLSQLGFREALLRRLLARRLPLRVRRAIFRLIGARWLAQMTRNSASSSPD